MTASLSTSTGAVTSTAADTAYFAPRARIAISGVTLAADVSQQVLSVHYDNNIDLADMATVVLDNTANCFTDSPLFEPGKEIELHLGYGDELHPMMLGTIASVAPSFPQSGAPTLTVTAYDKSHRLRHDVPDRPAFLFTNDSLMATQIALEAGLIPVVDPSMFAPAATLPRTAPDMAILKERAQANFFEVYVSWDKLYFRFPRPQTDVVTLEWGRNLSSFAPRLSYAGLAGIQVVRGYNEDLATNILGVMTTAALDLDSVVERLGEAGVGALASLGRRVVSKQSVKSPVDAVALAKALLQEILDGMYEASGSCIGLPALRAGTFVEVTGVGKRFSGRYRLTKVTHTLDSSGYRTQFEVTQRSGSSLLGLVRKSTVDTPPPNRRPRIDGVLVAQVRTVSPATCSVGVHLPNTPETDVVSVRCTLLAGSDHGGYFLPEMGDQVLVAFVEGDIGNGHVLGTVWALKDAVPTRLRLKSVLGHEIVLDDAKQKIVVEHATGASVTIAPDGSVSVTAKAGVTLSTDTGGITLSAKSGDITLDATAGDISLTSKAGKVALTAAKDIAVTSGAAGVKVEAAKDVEVTSKAAGVAVDAAQEIALTSSAAGVTVDTAPTGEVTVKTKKVAVKVSDVMDVSGR